MGSSAGGLGTLAGGVGGFLLGGPVGAAAGASMGGALGGLLSGNAPGNSNFNAVGISPEQLQAQQAASAEALKRQNDFANAVGAQGGLANQSQALDMMRQQAMGQGPNPAQAQLAQATAANTSNQAALMAGQRGASANSGLMARQIGMQGAANQQNAAGQAATLGAQQQLAGQQQFGNMATQQVNQQQQANSAAMGGAQGNYQIGAGQMGNQNAINSGQASANAGRNAGMAGGLLGAIGPAMSMFGGGSSASAAQPGDINIRGSNGNIVNPDGFAKGGTVNGLESGPRSTLCAALTMKSGGSVPGQAAVAGDSSKNDTVPAMLSPGEVVIDKDTLAEKGKAGDAARFLQAYLTKKNSGKK